MEADTAHRFEYWEYLFTTRPNIGLLWGFAPLSGVILDVILVIMVVLSMNFVRRGGYFQVGVIFADLGFYKECLVSFIQQAMVGRFSLLMYCVEAYCLYLTFLNIVLRAFDTLEPNYYYSRQGILWVQLYSRM